MAERITVSEAAEQLGMCVPLFRKLAREGKLPFVIVSNAKHRRTYWIVRQKFERWIHGENN